MARINPSDNYTAIGVLLPGAWPRRQDDYIEQLCNDLKAWEQERYKARPITIPERFRRGNTS